MTCRAMEKIHREGLAETDSILLVYFRANSFVRLLLDHNLLLGNNIWLLQADIEQVSDYYQFSLLASRIVASPVVSIAVNVSTVSSFQRHIKTCSVAISPFSVDASANITVFSSQQFAGVAIVSASVIILRVPTHLTHPGDQDLGHLQELKNILQKQRKEPCRLTASRLIHLENVNIDLDVSSSSILLGHKALTEARAKMLAYGPR